ncbi:hypothetical protein BDP27DRAFT_1313919 [Rhodocollybia butyracea]|uniref:UBC core domain-containing protein n=1 Tax=Rhodocollybia butyracea TaxID=206335 RepID=A0A9P5Q0Y8_9AGAR|nr:hypothetical protein BDP27DRAFT_1313919 [Rhodocollybia butyracea]
MNINSNSKAPVTKFYQQDVVQKIAHPHSIGIVLRCWHDAEDIPPLNNLDQDPLMRPLNRGEVGVSFVLQTDKREIIPESDLILLDRTLQPGDYVKRNVDDVQSGVVLNVRVKGRLEHAISGEPVEGWKTSEDLDMDRQADIGDYVVYEDWVGQIIELYDENIIEAPSGQLVRLPEFGSRLSVGEKSESILPPPTGGVQNMLGFFFGTGRNTGVQTVIAVKHTVYAIAWLALNQTLDHSDAETRQRPQRFWYGADISKLTLVRNRLDFQMRIGERVQMKNVEGLPFTKHGKEEAGGVVTVHTFNVTATESEVDLFWQDGTKETLRSVDVISYLNPDEYDCWPGDHVFFVGDGKSIPGVVQTVDAAQRTATVLLGPGKIEQVSLLELDVQGASDSTSFETDGLGVRRGENVFIHAPGQINGWERPRVPRIGELEPWVRSNPFSQSGQLDGWRQELATIGADIATRRSHETVEEGMIKTMPPVGTFLWFGEVTDLHPDGTVEILFPEGTVATYPLERLTKLYDSIEQLEDELYEVDSDEEHRMHGIWDYEYLKALDEEYDSGDDNEEEGMDPDEDSLPVSLSVSLDPATSSSPPSSEPSMDLDSSTVESPKTDENGNGNENWKNFKILSSAPPDHAYFGTTPVQPSRHFMSRLQREYRILTTSLPENILVRAYEDRADLLRTLIIGPQNTPYEDSPFVIDWHLADYPHSPPSAHFHSLTNGNGRVNPNLYEEGKVCLSILNTWTGDRSESWDANRSSLLQALVSIQGLVLVREPWFCEPAYEKLRGTEEGTVNSRLYSEKAYVLSRGFIRRTLETSFTGLETEIRWLYYSNKLLEKVLNNCQALIHSSRQQSEESMEDQERCAISRLTAGGIIALERHARALQTLLDSHIQSI